MFQRSRGETKTLMNNPLTRDFHERLSKIKGLTAIGEEALDNQAKSLKDRLSKDLSTCSKSQEEDICESYAMDCFELSTELPTIFRYSMFTASISAFESYLCNTATGYASVKKATVHISEIQGKGIRRAQVYCQEVMQLDFPVSNPAWNNILNASDLRNFIVHSNGNIPEDRKKLQDWIANTPFINFSGTTITLERDFINTLLEWYSSFATDFDQACHALGLWKLEFPDLPE